jgi:hypothetical protein
LLGQRRTLLAAPAGEDAFRDVPAAQTPRTELRKNLAAVHHDGSRWQTTPLLYPQRRPGQRKFRAASLVRA